MRKLLRQTLEPILVVCLALAMTPPVLAQNTSVSTATVIAALQKGQNDDAVKMADALLRADPKSFKVWTLRGLGLERSGHPKEALTDYQHALSLSPDYLPALEGAAQLDYKAQSPQAIPILHRILEQFDAATRTLRVNQVRM